MRQAEHGRVRDSAKLIRNRRNLMAAALRFLLRVAEMQRRRAPSIFSQVTFYCRSFVSSDRRPQAVKYPSVVAIVNPTNNAESEFDGSAARTREPVAQSHCLTAESHFGIVKWPPRALRPFLARKYSAHRVSDWNHRRSRRLISPNICTLDQ